MCGRYLFFDGKNRKIHQLIEQAEKKLPPETFSSLSLHEVFPKDYVFTGIYDEKNHRFRSAVMQWGFALKAKTVVNARIETFRMSSFYADTKPCVILCSGYYEWSKEKTKYLFTRRDESMYLAGLYHFENHHPVFVILTEEAVGSCAEIHHREPIVLTYEKAQAWCQDITMPVQSFSIHERNFSPADQNKD